MNRKYSCFAMISVTLSTSFLPIINLVLRLWFFIIHISISMFFMFIEGSNPPSSRWSHSISDSYTNSSDILALLIYGVNIMHSKQLSGSNQWHKNPTWWKPYVNSLYHHVNLTHCSIQKQESFLCFEQLCTWRIWNCFVENHAIFHLWLYGCLK